MRQAFLFQSVLCLSRGRLRRRGLWTLELRDPPARRRSTAPPSPTVCIEHFIAGARTPTAVPSHSVALPPSLNNGLLPTLHRPRLLPWHRQPDVRDHLRRGAIRRHAMLGLPLNNLFSTTLALAEQACSMISTCSGVSDYYCNGMFNSADHYALWVFAAAMARRPRPRASSRSPCPRRRRRPCAAAPPPCDTRPASHLATAAAIGSMACETCMAAHRADPVRAPSFRWTRRCARSTSPRPPVAPTRRAAASPICIATASTRSTRMTITPSATAR